MLRRATPFRQTRAAVQGCGVVSSGRCESNASMMLVLPQERRKPCRGQSIRNVTCCSPSLCIVKFLTFCCTAEQSQPTSWPGASEALSTVAPLCSLLEHYNVLRGVNNGTLASPNTETRTARQKKLNNKMTCYSTLKEFQIENFIFLFLYYKVASKVIDFIERECDNTPRAESFPSRQTLQHHASIAKHYHSTSFTTDLHLRKTRRNTI